eukprot:SAG22_NODE_9828_length_567_cov_1.641026_1_plen_100_part_01
MPPKRKQGGQQGKGRGRGGRGRGGRARGRGGRRGKQPYQVTLAEEPASSDGDGDDSGGEANLADVGREIEQLVEANSGCINLAKLPQVYKQRFKKDLSPA